MNRANFFNPAGRALARDPVPIMIPCHEPIAGDDEAAGAGLKAQHRLQKLKGMRA
jgi:O6-methylguanine-DNA--protein-cysteine methyltransferase